MIHAVSCSSPAAAASRSGLLYVRSSSAASPVLPSASVALVGTRRPSHGAALAFAFASHSAQLGFAVVSGLALGCDSAAHRGCLSVAGTTVAVLPCGVDRVAPVSNSQLGEAILNSGGCFVSQYPPGTPPKNFRFAERNRVIAALSQAVIVMECERKSGTMHTARFALEQNKPLACYVPESGPVSSGCRLLLEEHGAAPLRNCNDLKLFLNTLSCESRQS